MYALFLALLSAAIGWASYREARRAGKWSWGEFGLTLAGIALVLIVIAPWELSLMRLGPDHALLATALLVIPIAIGVSLLARYLSKRRKAQMH